MKSIFLIILIPVLVCAQYDDTGIRGKYFAKKDFTETVIPTFETSKDKLPSPILENNPEFLELYWKSWQLAFDHYKNPPTGSPFVSAYIDEAFAPNIFQWDTFFKTVTYAEKLLKQQEKILYLKEENIQLIRLCLAGLRWKILKSPEINHDLKLFFQF